MTLLLIVGVVGVHEHNPRKDNEKCELRYLLGREDSHYGLCQPMTLGARLVM